MSFIGTLQKMVATVAPWFLRQKNVGAFLESVALTIDGATESLAQGLRLSQPLRCDESALPVLSRDRSITLYPTEPTASKRFRLSQWWQLHRQRGTHQGEMRHVQPYFLPGTLPMIRIVHQAGDGSSATWHTLDSDGVYTIHRATPSNWDWDGNASQWSRFWVIIYVDALSLPTAHTWGDGGTWGDGEAWGGLFLPAVYADIIAASIEWKSAHSAAWGVIFATDPDSFDPTATATTLPDGSSSLPDGNWGQWSKIVDGERVPARLTSARYCEVAS